MLIESNESIRLTIDRSEKRRFIGICYFSEYEVLLKYVSITNTILQNRFEKIMAMLHCCVNYELDPSNNIF